MVKNPGKALWTNTFKPINIPEPVSVEEDSSALPVAVRMKRRQVVSTIEDRWRIDDEWWRSEPISRLYYVVLLDSGHRLVLYKNLANKCWYCQAY
jgi:hypothetical protein